MPSSIPTDELVTLHDIPVPEEGPLTPQQAVVAFRRAVQRGDEWYPALLEVISRWVAPDEEVGGVYLQYLIAGEAFDWLLLAQRLVDSVEDLIPPAQAEALIVHGTPPRNETEDEFEAALGPAKYRAHLNFQYGVVVEELLLLATELELHKTGHLARHGAQPADIEAYERVYGKSLEELKVLYSSETGDLIRIRQTQAEARTFTYWLSKYRIRYAEPARIASDTRKAMTVLARMEGTRTRRARLRAAAERRAALG